MFSFVLILLMVIEILGLVGLVFIKFEKCPAIILLNNLSWVLLSFWNSKYMYELDCLILSHRPLRLCPYFISVLKLKVWILIKVNTYIETRSGAWGQILPSQKYWALPNNGYDFFLSYLLEFKIYKKKCIYIFPPEHIYFIEDIFINIHVP